MALRPGLRTLSLCSGYGGLDLGVWLATGGTSRVVCHVEREVFAASVLVAQMEAGNLAQAPVWSDLRTLDARRWRGAVDLVTAGIPCQPFSLAGKQRGRDDPRWLGPDLLRIVRKSGAQALYIEEVPAFARAGLPTIVQAVEAWGWRWAAVRVAAEDCGAPHRRIRLFVLAVADAGGGRLEAGQRHLCGGQSDDDGGDAAVADPNSEGRQGRQRHADDPGQERGGITGSTGGGAVGHPEGQQREPRSGQDRFERAARGSGGRDGLSYWPPGRDPAAWTSIPAEYQPAHPTIRGVADGTPRSVDESGFPEWPHRIRAVGNGVVPLAAAVAWRVLVRQLGL